CLLLRAGLTPRRSAPATLPHPSPPRPRSRPRPSRPVRIMTSREFSTFDRGHTVDSCSKQFDTHRTGTRNTIRLHGVHDAALVRCGHDAAEGGVPPVEAG